VQVPKGGAKRMPALASIGVGATLQVPVLSLRRMAIAIVNGV